jgi:PadR family transcriptional regulator, regulatory protein PadR
MEPARGPITEFAQGPLFSPTLPSVKSRNASLIHMDIPMEGCDTLIWAVHRNGANRGVGDADKMGTKKSEVLQGTLDLMVLKTLHAMGPLHGFGIARRIEQVSRDVLQLNEGTVYTALLRLQQQGWIAAEWGTSENNRKAKFYSITEDGQKQLELEREDWKRISTVVHRLLRLEGER